MNVSPQNQDKGIPLCLPDNFTWDPLTREIKKISDDRRFLHPVSCAVKMLRQIKEPVCVVTIAGPCRAGKSYIMDEVFGQMEVFPIGHLVDPETTGIWMWIVPQTFQDSRGRNFRVILLDSEGTNAINAEGQNDHQIFTLTVLLASVLIYNSIGVPKRTDLDDLEFIVKLSQLVRIRSKGGPDDKDQFRNTFPFFFWLLRDVTNKLPPDCEDFNQYFSTRHGTLGMWLDNKMMRWYMWYVEATECALKAWQNEVFKDTETSANENQGKVAEGILNFFSGFESYALPSPTSDSDIMHDISNNRDKLNPKFREGVRCFETLLKSKLVPKRSINQGEYVTGEALGALVELYAEAINDPDAIPNVEKAWDIYVKKKCSEAKKDALEIYDQVMAQLTCLPCDGKKLLENHETSQKKGMEKFVAETVELVSTIIRNELSQLTKWFDEKLRLLKGENAALTKKSCDDLLVKLKREYLDPVLEKVRGRDGAKVKYGEIMEGWSKIKEGFNSKAVGALDVRADVFFRFNQYLQDEVMKYEEIHKQMKDYDENISKERVAKEYIEKEKKRLEAQLAEVAKQDEARQKKMEMLEKRQQNELKLIKEQSKADKDALEKQMQMMKEAGMEVQAQLQNQLHDAVEREKEATEAFQAMKQLSEERVKEAKADLEAVNEKFHEMREENLKSQMELTEQLKIMALKDTQTIQRLNDMTQIIEEHRQEATFMKKQIQILTDELINANKPGLISWVFRKIF